MGRIISSTFVSAKLTPEYEVCVDVVFFELNIDEGPELAADDLP